jgi:starch-binding outer membrane protein, SusD/RagB family
MFEKKNIYQTFPGLRLPLYFTFMLTISCESFIEVDPPKNEIVIDAVFESDASAYAALNGVYSMMMLEQSFTYAGLEKCTGLASDELLNYSSDPDNSQFFQNALSARNEELLTNFWIAPYKYINNANAILEAIIRSESLSKNAKDELEGQAKFIRAFAYFYLVNLFGDIPYPTETDYNVTSKLPRTNANSVNDAIEQDLLDAANLLQEGYQSNNFQRIYPSRLAAQALLARHYLMRGQWASAAAYATMVIENDLLHLQDDLNMVFTPASTETIWQLKPVIPGTYTQQAQLFILTTAPNSYSRIVSLAPAMYNAFEAEDMRKGSWTAVYTEGGESWEYAYKYKSLGGPDNPEYNVVLRLAELYLIRAEASAQLEQLSDALNDLNAIRARAGLPLASQGTKEELLAAILDERRLEFFCEWGHRWLDLKRSGIIDNVLGSLKADWQSHDQLFPIPESERLLNNNLSQNPGY